MNIFFSILLFLTPITYVANPDYEYSIGEITMYTNSPEETDEEPNITASGWAVTEGIAACPERLDMHTIIEVGGKRYRCLDRMNKRYRGGEYYDLFTFDKKEALAFGRQQLPVKIIR